MNTQILRQCLERAKTENGGLDQLGMSFYARLFDKYPSVRPLFTTPSQEQQKKLMASVGAIVAAVENPTVLSPYLHAMGIRHLKYKTESAHYEAVSENLLAVLKAHLSKEGEWTDEMESTWSEALKVVSQIMIEAAENPTKYAEELRASGYESDGFSKSNSKPWEIVASS